MKLSFSLSVLSFSSTDELLLGRHKYFGFDVCTVHAEASGSTASHFFFFCAMCLNSFSCLVSEFSGFPSKSEIMLSFLADLQSSLTITNDISFATFVFTNEPQHPVLCAR